MNLSNLPRCSGIYTIRSIVDDRAYIGSAVNIKERCKHHRLGLRKDYHHNGHLQNFYNKYGPGALYFKVLEHCEASELVDREQHYINTLNPNFNICKTAGSTLGKQHSEETKRLISRKKKGTIRNVGRKANLETRMRLSKAGKGKHGGPRAPFTQEHRTNMSKVRKERKLAAGSRNYFAILDEEKVMKIKKELTRGTPSINLAKRFNVSVSAISHIKTGRNWKHIKRGE